jgi:hypothetical protein
MKPLLLALLLLAATPAHALQITDLRLNCDGVWLAPGVTLTNTSCQGQGVWLDAIVGPFPVPAPVTIRFALTLDGVLAGEEFRVLENIDAGAPYTALGMGWRLPLDGCCVGQLVHALASLEIIGGPDPGVEFTLAVPTPEPMTMALVGVTLFTVGWVARRRGR